MPTLIGPGVEKFTIEPDKAFKQAYVAAILPREVLESSPPADAERVKVYKAAFETGAVMPAIVVTPLPGNKYGVMDGTHRLAALPESDTHVRVAIIAGLALRSLRPGDLARRRR